MRPLTKNVVSAALAVFALSAVRSGDALEIQSFVDYCAYRGVNFTGGHWLGGYCRNDMTAIFGNNYSWIDLDYCVGNNGGQLIAYENGNYSTSCTKCAVDTKTKTIILSCNCVDADDNNAASSLDLNTTIYNYNGSIGCFNHLGNKSWFEHN